MISHTILPELSLCVFTGQGNISSEEVIEEFRSCIADQRWQSQYDYLYDIRQLDNGLPYEEFDIVRDFVLSTPMSKRAKHAIIVSNTVVRSSSVKWSREMEPYNMTYRTFRSLDTGLDWLDISREHYRLFLFRSNL